jgi:hypothetical protein
MKKLRQQKDRETDEDNIGAVLACCNQTDTQRIKITQNKKGHCAAEINQRIQYVKQLASLHFYYIRV